ncbi:MAG TPA: peptide MFS transporter, partial [Chitinophagaceae bacterium]|nr:peptide MFS transporter [Chitinophagaceae bacterium]
AFTIFYMGINLGAFFSPLVCGTLAEKIDFKWGFFAAGIGMVIGLLLFMALKNKYLNTEDGKPIGKSVKPLDTKNIFYLVGSIALIFFLLNFKTLFNNNWDVIGWVIYGSMIAIPVIILSDKTITPVERSRILVIFILAFFVIFFWGAFEQAGASLTIFADRQTDRHIFGWEMPASYFQSINPLAIIALAPVFSALWLTLGNKNAEPSTPKKMALGLVLVAVGYLLIAYAVKGVDASTKVSMFWLFSLYIVHTMGELCLSPIGLSMVAKLSPLRFSSLLMGTWFLANAAANKFAGTLSELIPSETKPTTSFIGIQITNLYEFFTVFIVMCGLAAGILFMLSGKLQKMMHGIK